MYSLLVLQQSVVLISEGGRPESPGTIEAAAIWMAASKSVGTGKGDYFLVIEAHAVEDLETGPVSRR